MTSEPAADESVALLARLSDAPGESIPVNISYEIISLFSEGLYQSPHKAIEELVTNGYDAGATEVIILTPRTGEDGPAQEDSLWVVDNGSGMSPVGFRQLWRVAASDKYNSEGLKGRLPIGQFGIGKLAAYVLAWRLTHISKTETGFHYTSMNFKDIHGRMQNDSDYEPMSVALHRIDETKAKEPY